MVGSNILSCLLAALRELYARLVRTMLCALFFLCFGFASIACFIVGVFYCIVLLLFLVFYCFQFACKIHLFLFMFASLKILVRYRFVVGLEHEEFLLFNCRGLRPN